MIRAQATVGFETTNVQAAVAVQAAKDLKVLREAAPQLPDGVCMTIIQFAMDIGQDGAGLCRGLCPEARELIVRGTGQLALPIDMGDGLEFVADDGEEAELRWVAQTCPTGFAVCYACARPRVVRCRPSLPELGIVGAATVVCTQPHFKVHDLRHVYARAHSDASPTPTPNPTPSSLNPPHPALSTFPSRV